jgi:hypothetical protein
MPTKGIYIYGIVPNFYSAEMFRTIENSGLYAIPFQNISAIVSDRDSTLIDYSDRESLGHLLVHHQRTIEELMSIGFTMLISMRLGTIVNSKEETFKILNCGYNLIIDTLKHIEFLIEIDLVVTWADFNSAIKEIADHPDIVELKNDILKKSDTLSQIDQMKVGLLVQEKLKVKNTKVKLNILDTIAITCLDIKTHEVMNDQMVTNSAFLIERSKQEMFEQIIDNLDAENKGLLNFKLVGPLPCYSFYTLEYKKMDPEQVEQARIMLELEKETTESEIKKAYLNKARLFHPDADLENNDEIIFNNISKAYHTLLEYSVSARQSSKEDIISLAKEHVIKNSFLVKIKE